VRLAVGVRPAQDLRLGQAGEVGRVAGAEAAGQQPGEAVAGQAGKAPPQRPLTPADVDGHVFQMETQPGSPPVEMSRGQLDSYLRDR
jgi:hypothetical protein